MKRYLGITLGIIWQLIGVFMGPSQTLAPRGAKPAESPLLVGKFLFVTNK